MADKNKRKLLEVTSSYKVKILSEQGLFSRAASYYKNVIAWLLPVFDANWEDISSQTTDKKRFNFAEKLVHTTENNTAKYNFDSEFPEMPSYLRRAAIAHALGAVSSYRSNRMRWEKSGKKGKEPKLALERHAMPVFYRGNMCKKKTLDEMLSGNADSITLKLYDGKKWKWFNVACRHQDAKYLARYWTGTDASAPILKHKKGKYWLAFSFTEQCDLKLNDLPLQDRRILAVDLGINIDAACSVMTSDGTVVARRFINFPADKDRIGHILNAIKGEQRKHGPKGGRGQWRQAMRIAREHGIKVAMAIVDFAIGHDAGVIVFERLEFKGRKRGAKRQRLHLWRKKTIQAIAEHRAHRNLMRISRVCAWGTSRLAFDGSGRTERPIVMPGKGKKNYSVCRFPTGKIYNADLNASYNIGARYFLRGMCELDPDLAAALPPTTQRVHAHLLSLAKQDSKTLSGTNNRQVSQ